MFVGLSTALHVEFGLVVGGETAPMLLVCFHAIIADGSSLIGFVKRRKPEEINAPSQGTTNRLFPILLHILVASFCVTGVIAAGAGPASLCVLSVVFLLRLKDVNAPPFMK